MTTHAAERDAAMSETLTVTFHCTPGIATPQKAADFHTAIQNYLDAVAKHLGLAVSFGLTAFEWKDDGIDDITVTIGLPEGMTADETGERLATLVESATPTARQIRPTGENGAG
jgi:hypothetical protein